MAKDKAISQQDDIVNGENKNKIENIKKCGSLTFSYEKVDDWYSQKHNSKSSTRKNN
jgi:hypothetical protein